MVAEFENQVSQTLEEIKSQGLFKTERVITSPQDAHIAITGGKCVLNMCANNYLGLADHRALVAAAPRQESIEIFLEVPVEKALRFRMVVAPVSSRNRFS